MGLRFKKVIKLAPGLKINLSKSGLSTSVGKPGSTINFSKRGTKTTIGAPGTGVSYQTSTKKIMISPILIVVLFLVGLWLFGKF